MFDQGKSEVIAFQPREEYRVIDIQRGKKGELSIYKARKTPPVVLQVYLYDDERTGIYLYKCLLLIKIHYYLYD